MRQIIDFKRRMYAGNAVFVALYYDSENNRYNYTTLSSMYNLGRMVVMGSAKNNFSKCIQNNEDFTINFLSINYLDDILLGGEEGSEVNKLKESQLDVEYVEVNKIKYPIIKQAKLAYKCSFKEFLNSESYPDYNNIICNLDYVFASEEFDVNNYEPLIFVGTDQGHFFKRGVK